MIAEIICALLGVIVAIQTIFLILLYGKKKTMEDKVKKLHSEVSYSRPAIDTSTVISMHSPIKSSAVTIDPTSPNINNFKRYDFQNFLQTGIFSQNDNVLFPYGGKNIPATIVEINVSSDDKFKLVPKQPIPNLKNGNDGFWVSESTLLPTNNFNGFILDNVPIEILNAPNKLVPKLSAYCLKGQQIITNTIWSTKEIYVKYVEKGSTVLPTTLNNYGVNGNVIGDRDIVAVQKIVQKSLSSYKGSPGVTSTVIITASCVRNQVKQLKVDCNNKTVVSIAVL